MQSRVRRGQNDFREESGCAPGRTAPTSFFPPKPSCERLLHFDPRSRKRAGSGGRRFRFHPRRRQTFIKDVGIDVRSVLPDDGAQSRVNLHRAKDFGVVTNGLKHGPAEVWFQIYVSHRAVGKTQSHPKPLQRLDRLNSNQFSNFLAFLLVFSPEAQWFQVGGTVWPDLPRSALPTNLPASTRCVSQSWRASAVQSLPDRGMQRCNRSIPAEKARDENPSLHV